MAWYTGKLNFVNSVVPDTAQDIEDKLHVLLSESNQQQQDLDRTLNDLSSLKLGFALLQQDNIEQAKRFQELLWINQKLLWQLKKQLKKLDNNDATFQEKLDDIDADIQKKFETLQEKLDNIDADIQEKAETFQEKLDDIDTDIQENAETFQEKLDDIDADIQEKSETVQEKLDDIDADLQEKAETLEEIEGRVHPCGGTGWRRAIFLDMTDPNEVCPGEFVLLPDIPVRACGGSGGDSTDQLFFDVSEAYSKVCGRIKGFQIGSAAAFRDMQEVFMDDYVHGVSVGRFSDIIPSEHIWTFAVGSTDGDPTLDTVCPCASDGGANLSPAPEFVGNNYFCESGNKDPTATPGQFYSDTLWDGKNCFGVSECCAFSHPPYFVRDLGTRRSEDLLIIINTEEKGSNIAIQLIEIYIQ